METSKFKAVGEVICIIHPGGQLANYKTMADQHNVTIQVLRLGIGLRLGFGQATGFPKHVVFVSKQTICRNASSNSLVIIS